MITTGWNLAGAAYIGDTGGDADAFSNELILTDNVGNSSGAIFYSHPIDLGTCNQWNVQFDSYVEKMRHAMIFVHIPNKTMRRYPVNDHSVCPSFA